MLGVNDELLDNFGERGTSPGRIQYETALCQIRKCLTRPDHTRSNQIRNSVLSNTKEHKPLSNCEERGSGPHLGK